jgi:hypothetical protein
MPPRQSRRAAAGRQSRAAPEAAVEAMQARVADLDFEVHEEEFGYWRKHEKRR